MPCGIQASVQKAWGAWLAKPVGALLPLRDPCGLWRASTWLMRSVTRAVLAFRFSGLPGILFRQRQIGFQLCWPGLMQLST